MPEVAKFLVDHTFHLHQRGIVIIGEITEGSIKIGDHIRTVPGTLFKILSIENIREQKRRPLVGLRIADGVISETDFNEIKSKKLAVINR